MHCSIRFGAKKIVFNTKTNGEWGKEEHVKNPFKSGSKVDFRIRAHGDHFEARERELVDDISELHRSDHRRRQGHCQVRTPRAN